MKNLEKLDTSKLLNGLMKYISFVIIVVVLLVITSISLAREQTRLEQQNLYNTFIDKSLNHVTRQFLKDFSHKVTRLIETRDLVSYVKAHDRESLYKLLKPKYDSLKEETPDLEVIHVHLADGTSLLRVHKPDNYGDDIASLRPMLQEVHKNHKMIDGYETGLHANVYRIIGPIFDKNGEYIGALEVGLNPQFLLRTVEGINKLKGALFLKEDVYSLYSEEAKKKDLVIDGYKLQSKTDASLKDLYEVLKKENIIPENAIMEVNSKRYLTHLIVLKSFQNKEDIKLLFFQEMSMENPFLNKMQLLIYLGIVLILLFSIRLIYNRIKGYQADVTASYSEKIEIIEELKERIELAINGANDGLWDWNLTKNEVYFSPRWKEMLGYKDKELKNEFETWKSKVHPKDLAQAIKDIEESHMNPEAEYNAIHRLRHKDGHWVWVLDRGQTIFDESGKAIRMVGFHTDISEIKELEIELKNAKHQFDLFMNNAPYMVLIKDEMQEIVYKNYAAKQDYDFIASHVQEEIEGLLQRTSKEGETESVFEFESDGVEYSFRALSFAIPQASFKVYTGEIYIDISEEKLLAKELKLQNEVMIAQSRHAEMGEMISMIAHQWRQPLSVISMDVNNILVDVELDKLNVETLLEELKDINMQTSHLSQTIDDFRNFFMPDRVEDFALIKDVFIAASNFLSKSLLNNDISVENSFENETEILVFDRELQQVFINILKNAKEALEQSSIKDKKIRTKIYETQDDVIVEISDNGGGISEDVIEKIFEPYFSTKQEKNGTGLGLYMSKMIVEKHLSGKISVENKNEVTSFTISIPKKTIQE